MDVSFVNFGFYNVDIDYLCYLSETEPEVQYSSKKAYEQKPFLGIIIFINDYHYIIPLTSGKSKHSKWKNVGRAHYLIYEKVNKSELRKNDIYKSVSENEALKIFAVLDIKKMIPVKEGVYSRIEFSKLSDLKYADLLEKEYRFCQKIQDGILTKAKQIYFEQKNTGVVHQIYCNFEKLEAACDTYRTEITD